MLEQLGFRSVRIAWAKRALVDLEDIISNDDAGLATQNTLCHFARVDLEQYRSVELTE